MDREISEVIRDLYQFNCIVLSGLVDGLDLDKDDMAVRLQSMAKDARGMHPDSQVRHAHGFRGTLSDARLPSALDAASDRRRQERLGRRPKPTPTV
jgi:hypothetical protein